MKVATQGTDRVLHAIEAYEQNSIVPPMVCFDVFEHAAMHTSVLTTGSRTEQCEYVERFVAMAPTVDMMCGERMTAQHVTNVWVRFAEDLYGSKNRITVHMNLVNKLVELTAAFVTNPGSGAYLGKLHLNVDHFYKQAIAWNEPEIAFTAFGLSKLINRYTLAQIAMLPELPAELIEQHAFTVPREVAERFVVHPNCPLRVRTVLATSLPLMEQAG